MANWCEGSLRIRGKKENIENFLKNEIVYTVYENNELVEKPATVEEHKNSMLITQDGKDDSFYIRGTYRNFFFTYQIEVYWPEHEEDEEIVINIDDFNVAWSFKEQGWPEHAEKYGIDFRMFGFEQGMEFSQVMTVTRDGSASIETKEYKNWLWECPFPNMGG